MILQCCVVFRVHLFCEMQRYYVLYRVSTVEGGCESRHEQGVCEVALKKQSNTINNKDKIRNLPCLKIMSYF
ncbi:hypothetical protein Fmac_012559 [Flemingia macrophylla]|uniref:Secreted protein n=1 Tax=Flemingia macrophylla TaxID=520843 RepID=A0ABD1MQM4_9FABA